MLDFQNARHKIKFELWSFKQLNATCYFNISISKTGVVMSLKYWSETTIEVERQATQNQLNTSLSSRHN